MAGHFFRWINRNTMQFFWGLMVWSAMASADIARVTEFDPTDCPEPGNTCDAQYDGGNRKWNAVAKCGTSCTYSTCVNSDTTQTFPIDHIPFQAWYATPYCSQRKGHLVLNKLPATTGDFEAIEPNTVVRKLPSTVNVRSWMCATQSTTSNWGSWQYATTNCNPCNSDCSCQNTITAVIGCTSTPSMDGVTVKAGPNNNAGQCCQLSERLPVGSAYGGLVKPSYEGQCDYYPPSPEKKWDITSCTCYKQIDTKVDSSVIPATSTPIYDWVNCNVGDSAQIRCDYGWVPTGRTIRHPICFPLPY